MKVALVAAVAENGVIGSDGEMPWHYPADLRKFKETTMGHPVVMGRKTYESIADRLGGPLPGRTNVVLSRRDSLCLPEGAVHARDLDAAFEAAETALASGQETAYVVGGATVYEACLDRADELVVTEIPEAPAGDTHFPEIGHEWTEHGRERVGDVSVVTYRRTSAGE
ncbi:dihydrofolate reductase [Natronomonas moolapensis 8.8.11]|uniref:dihydrofolate reductase n=1 Tax=Natronomonas moolapensis (strain DSM 18674 / CECT 7526 / JCM 14361 / 8.8.11) TaxID=268739 RepID=M1XKY7_NATM8|nr:dihydrofolate reductase [Natronomonas moolapensis]CCQ36752.1 dihydrofolate reductase [Natronomonas moolapensis 8.8.11]